MKVLLTGARGNLGSALQRLGLAHTWFNIDRGGWSGYQALVKEAKVIIHAASDLLTPIWQSPTQVMESNQTTTLWLLEELANNPGRRLVFISSCAVYGRSELTTEEITPTPISINGVTKLLNEEVIREFCTHHRLNYQIFRLFNTYGGSDQFSILSHLQRSLKTKQPFTLNNEGMAQRDFIHVDDIARVILELIEKPIKYPIINIGTGSATRIRDVVEAFKKKHPNLKLASGQRPEIEYSRADIAKLRAILPDFRFRAVLDFVRLEL